MAFLGMELPAWTRPALDPGFVPLSALFAHYAQGAAQPLAVAVEREDGQVSVYETAVFGTPDYARADQYYVERLVKLLLWIRGGFRVSVCGDAALGRAVAEAYAPGGARDFDRGFMERIYERPFEVRLLPYEARPAPEEGTRTVSGGVDGCRVGLDVGASGRKVCAMEDGVVVYSGQAPWQPKTNPDPNYHYEALVASLRDAAAHLPRVDGIGISTAGVLVGRKCMVASLFLALSQADFDRCAKDMFTRAAAALGQNIPCVVANDGDVAALAGAVALEERALLGISMGTSEAGGYVGRDGGLTGWLNELAFCPVDAQPQGWHDEWSGDVGCGVKYLSQDAAILLAGRAGLPLPEGNPSERFRAVRAAMEAGDPRAAAVYRDLGVYLGHAAALYARFYDLDRILVMGGVTGGPGGDLILEQARAVLAHDYPALSFALSFPDEKVRALGQSVAAASLPELNLGANR